MVQPNTANETLRSQKNKQKGIENNTNKALLLVVSFAQSRVTCVAGLRLYVRSCGLQGPLKEMHVLCERRNGPWSLSVQRDRYEIGA